MIVWSLAMNDQSEKRLLNERQKESLAFGVQGLENILQTFSDDIDKYCLAETSLGEFIERIEDGLHELGNHAKALRALNNRLESDECNRELSISTPGPSV